MSGKKSSVEGNERLKERRRLGRRRTRVVLYFFILVLIGAGVWGSWQPSVRIVELSISNGDARVEAILREQLSGTYFGIVPRDSFFFLSEHAIRTAILSHNALYQAVAIKRTGFTSLALTLHERVPVARWCGLAPLVGDALAISDGEYCYLFDAEGYIYSAADPSLGRAGIATGTATLNAFTVYDTLLDAPLEPLRATLAHARAMPDAFDFARKVGSLGSSVHSIVFRSDEADIFFMSGTRLTYVLGSEESSFTSLMSAKQSLNFSDGSLDYVDLRFSGKVYLKKRGVTNQEAP